MSWPHTDLPSPGSVSLGRVVAARLGHARRRQKSERFFDGYPDYQPTEMAVYDPSADDERREAMSPAEAWLLMVIFLLSASFVAWLLAVLSAFFGVLPR